MGLTKHSVENFAYCFKNDSGVRIAVSGDGALTSKSRELYKGVDLLVHEGFFVDKKSETHASITSILEYALNVRIPKVAIVHVNRDERKKISEIERIVFEAKEKGTEVFFPVDHQEIEL